MARTARDRLQTPSEEQIPEEAAGRIAQAQELARQREDVEHNRAAWNRWAPDYFISGLRAWKSDEPYWGLWELPESELRVLDEVGEGTDAIELGCGTAYACGWMAQRGAMPVGIDVAEAQLESARMFLQQFGASFPLVRASADEVPFEDESFDVALSEYGASTWLDPERWVPEAARLLRPGGLLVFFVNSSFLMTCTGENGTAAPALVRDYFGLGRCEFPADGTIEYQLGHGDWIRVLQKHGFRVEDLVEVRPPAGAKARYDFVDSAWARRWPSEESWKAR
jgi:ubiquinone/menaquinone biosynthesis C-methylase UbiE